MQEESGKRKKKKKYNRGKWSILMIVNKPFASTCESPSETSQTTESRKFFAADLAWEGRNGVGYIYVIRRRKNMAAAAAVAH